MDDWGFNNWTEVPLAPAVAEPSGHLMVNSFNQPMATMPANITNMIMDEMLKAPCNFGLSKSQLIKFSPAIIGYIILSFVTVFGNLLIIAAILTEPRLRNNITNHYYISLASADTMVGSLSMPAMLVVTLHGCWPLGNLMCDLYTSVDALACAASFLGLCTIAYDRYQAVSDPFKHMRVQSVSRVRRQCMIIWAVALLAWSPIIVFQGATWPNKQASDCEFRPSANLALFATLFVYYIPIAFMVTYYVRLFLIIRRTLRGTIQVGEKKDGVDVGKEISSAPETKVTSLGENSVSYTSDGSTGGEKKKSNDKMKAEEKRSRAKKEQKAAKTLGLVMGVFIFCWSGYIITWPLSLFFPNLFPDWMFEATCWLACGNSSINPFLYVFSSQDFRIGCKKVLLRFIGRK